MAATTNRSEDDYAAARAAYVVGKLRLLPPGLAIETIRLAILEAMAAQREACVDAAATKEGRGFLTVLSAIQNATVATEGAGGGSGKDEPR